MTTTIILRIEHLSDGCELFCSIKEDEQQTQEVMASAEEADQLVHDLQQIAADIRAREVNRSFRPRQARRWERETPPAP